MDLESVMGQAVLPSPSLLKHHSTPPTCTTPGPTSLTHCPNISEFTLDAEASQLTQMIKHASIDDKENDKHTTDRFIPLRRGRSQENSLASLEEQNNH